MRKDARMEVTTESIINMKTLKLFAWQESFMFRIFAKRAKEMETLRRWGLAIACSIGFVYLIPSLVPAVTFATYIGLDNRLDFSIAVAALVLFQLMRVPLINFPRFIENVCTMFTSLKRI